MKATSFLRGGTYVLLLTGTVEALLAAEQVHAGDVVEQGVQFRAGTGSLLGDGGETLCASNKGDEDGEASLHGCSGVKWFDNKKNYKRSNCRRRGNRTCLKEREELSFNATAGRELLFTPTHSPSS